MPYLPVSLERNGMFEIILQYSVVLKLYAIFSETQQAEDPRVQWQQRQEMMIKEYVVVAQSDLMVCEVFVSCLLTRF